jgi:tetratricopeptide (TPR) repeat protein
MRNTFLLPILTLLLSLIPSAASGASGTQGGRESAYNQKGLEYFKEGFYQRLPKGQQREADQAFDLAATEFRNAIAVKPDFVEAHRNLARLHFVRKQFSEAAASYMNVTRLAPGDLDAYVQIALAYIELERFDEAIRQIELAKTQTDDPQAVQKLEGYVQKIRERK